MDEQEKQQIIKELREMRDAFEALHAAAGSNEPDAMLLRRYMTVTVKAVATLDSALVTLST